jgi:hypothetical protein
MDVAALILGDAIRFSNEATNPSIAYGRISRPKENNATPSLSIKLTGSGLGTNTSTSGGSAIRTSRLDTTEELGMYTEGVEIGTLLIASTGHRLTQDSQDVQSSPSILAFPSNTEMATFGHASTHAPHPSQSSWFINRVT